MKFGTLVRIPDVSLAEISSACDAKFGKLQEMHMDACQLVYKPVVYTNAAADLIRNKATAYGIDLSAQFCGYYDTYCLWDDQFDHYLAGLNSPIFGASRIEYLLSAIPFMQRVGIQDMIVHAGFLSNNPYDPKYTRMVACVRLLGGRLKDAGMNLLFETGGESPITLLRMFHDTGLDNLFVNLDTANLITSGFGNPVDALYTYGRYVRNMHAKDGMPPVQPGVLGTQVSIGTGYVDFPRVFQELRKLGYDRYVIIECEVQNIDHEQEIIQALAYLKTLL